MPARGERIAVLRDGAPESSFLAGYDPAENRLYAAFDAKIERGDVVAFRDLVRRVIEPPKRWRNPNTGRAHGCVLQLEDAPPFLPDLGHLYRLTSGGFDQVTKVYLEPGRTLIWSGPCSVKPESTIGSDVEVGPVATVVLQAARCSQTGVFKPRLPVGLSSTVGSSGW